MQQPYTRHEGNVVEQGAFKHIMAITLDPRGGYKEGVIRCITSRSGNLAIEGTIDHSELREARFDEGGKLSIGERIVIKNEEEVVRAINTHNLDFLGFEDPDLWFDERDGLLHLYFTIPLIDKKEHRHETHLGHAMGNDIHSLEMTMPVLMADTVGGAKELSVAPINKQGMRLNLVESYGKTGDDSYSIVRVAIAKNMSKDWHFGEVAFHPAKHNIPWIAGHASPGPLLPKEFIDLGEGKLLGIMNGCEANETRGGKTIYKDFSVGLFIYDYEKGAIDWVSPEPFLQDSESTGRKITFASQFVPTGDGEGILYAHIDDSYIKAYTLYREGLRRLLPVAR